MVIFEFHSKAVEMRKQQAKMKFLFNAKVSQITLYSTVRITSSDSSHNDLSLVPLTTTDPKASTKIFVKTTPLEDFECILVRGRMHLSSGNFSLAAKDFESSVKLWIDSKSSNQKVRSFIVQAPSLSVVVSFLI